MKKIIIICAIALSLLGGFMIRSFFANRENETLCGGWEELDLELDEETKAIFYQATNEYKPLKLVGKQVVAGLNYRFTALDKDNKTVTITIYQDLDGNCSISNIE